MSDYSIAELKGIAGYQAMQVGFYLLRSAYYVPETNMGCHKFDEFCKKVGELEDAELDEFLATTIRLGADISKEYWDCVLKVVRYKGDPIIPESIQAIPVDALGYIIMNLVRSVIKIKLPFTTVQGSQK